MPDSPSRGDVWYANFSPTIGREQAGDRPGLIVSIDLFNQGPSELVVALPLTRTRRGVDWHVRIDPPEGGLRDTSYVLCENVRAISTERLRRRLGAVRLNTLREVEHRLRILLDL